MFVRALLRSSLAILFLLTLGLAGCSEDVGRVTSPVGDGESQLLATGTDLLDLPEDGLDMDGYIAKGYYYPDDAGETEDEVYDPGNPEDRFDDGNESDKPIDAGRD